LTEAPGNHGNSIATVYFRFIKICARLLTKPAQSDFQPSLDFGCQKCEQSAPRRVARYCTCKLAIPDERLFTEKTIHIHFSSPSPEENKSPTAISRKTAKPVE
jgi:hypothetical protein